MDHQPLSKIVALAHEGRVVLPEFQRDFVWQPDAIRELLTSIFQDYYIGTFLFLESSTKKPLFPTRAIAGAKKRDEGDKVQLVLDGQQRISALYYATYEPAIALKQKKHPTRFYVDVGQAQRGDIDEAVKFVSAHGKRYRQIEADIDAGKLISVKSLANGDALEELIDSKRGLSKHRKVLRELNRKLEMHHVHIIDLETEDMDNIVNVFERTNRTGLRLGMFDLAVARCYSKGVNLRQSWDEFLKAQSDVAKRTDRDVPLKIMALANNAVPKAKEIFELLDNLERDEIDEEWESAVSGLWLADKRMRLTYGAVSPDLVPYTPAILPLGALLKRLERNKLNSATVFEKLDRWYWASLLTERYEAGGNTTALEDVKAVWEWIKNSKVPDWIENLESGAAKPTPELAGCTGGGLWRSVACLYWTKRPRDFISGEILELEDLDHVFPSATMKGREERDWILNRAPLSELTNRELKQAKTPKQFFKECLEGHGNDEGKLLGTLETHFITERAYRCLIDNDFAGFTKERERAVKAALFSLAGAAPPKP